MNCLTFGQISLMFNHTGGAQTCKIVHFAPYQHSVHKHTAQVCCKSVLPPTQLCNYLGTQGKSQQVKGPHMVYA